MVAWWKWEVGLPWWNGEEVEWRSGSVVEEGSGGLPWWNGEEVEWRSGRVLEEGSGFAVVEALVSSF